MIKFIALGSLIISSHIATATVSLTFSNPNNNEYALAANKAGGSDGVNGLYWGIIIDGGDGTLNEGGFSFTADQSSTALNGTDDVLFVSSSQTANLIFPPASVNVNGSMGSMADVDVEGLNGNKFGLIWFDSDDVNGSGTITVNNGDHYGFFTHEDLVIQNEGFPGDFASTFAPPLNAPMAADRTFDTIPEPSSVALLGLGSVALLLRRRR